MRRRRARPQSVYAFVVDQLVALARQLRVHERRLDRLRADLDELRARLDDAS